MSKTKKSDKNGNEVGQKLSNTISGNPKLTPKKAPVNADKKPIGRPPTKPKAPILEVKGIVSAPSDPTKIFELAYEKPQALKKIFEFFKKLDSDSIYLQGGAKGLSFLACDKNQTCQVRVRFKGSLLNWYYCGEPFTVGLKRKHFEKIFSGISANMFKVTLSIAQDDFSHLLVGFYCANRSPEQWKLILSKLEPDAQLFDFTEFKTEYPLNFNMDSDDFKSLVGKIGNHSQSFEIEYTPGKTGGTIITFSNRDKQIASFVRSLTSDHNVELADPNKHFRARIQVENVKSLANALIMDGVNIHCRGNGDMMFRSAVENQAVVIGALIRAGTE